MTTTNERELPTIPGRAYQVQRVEKVLPDLLPLPFGVVVLEPNELKEAESLFEYYEMLKAQVALLEDSFDSAEEMAEADNEEGAWMFISDKPSAINVFAETWENEAIVTEDSYLYDYFYEAAATEWASSPRRYSKYVLDDVVSSEASQYTLVASADGNGANFIRQTGVVGQPPRVSRVPVEVEDDGSDY
jgi:hypothetical protein